MTWGAIGIRRSSHRVPSTSGRSRSSYNEARITPDLDRPPAGAWSPRSRWSPAASIYRYWDWWGTLVALLRPAGAPRRS
ncbi:MAG: hypothetical protein WKG07_45845 [Hymenobacter sp.]